MGYVLELKYGDNAPVIFKHILKDFKGDIKLYHPLWYNIFTKPPNLQSSLYLANIDNMSQNKDITKFVKDKIQKTIPTNPTVSNSQKPQEVGGIKATDLVIDDT